jgi:CubicO group peptidase (beta-lactamase class C family)
MRPHSLRLVAASAIVAAAISIPSSTAAQPAPLAGFDAYVAQAVRDWKTPGLAIAVVKDDAVVFAKGYGVRKLGAPEPVDDRTLFAIGSTTKAITAAALGLLVDEGKLAWDDPVIKHLPWFALKDPYATREMRVRDLLTHRGGVPNTDLLWYGQSLSTREIVGRLKHVELETSFRTHFTYQNVMYAAAGEVVAAVSGMPWADFVTARFFRPLGMTGTIATAATLDRQPNVAQPHFEIAGKVEVIENASVDGVAPAGSVWSSVRDMAQWTTLLLAGGAVRGGAGAGSNGTRLLSEKTVAELFAPQTMVGEDAFYPTARLTKPHWTTYGLGWFQADYAGEKVDFHTGSIDGMVAIHGLVRDRGIGVFVLANLDHTELRHALMYRVFDAFLGRPARDWSADMLALYRGLAKEADERRATAEAERVAGTSPTLPLDRYAGTYVNEVFGPLAVTANGGSLRVQLGSAYQGPLTHFHYDTFTATWDARWRGTARATFRLDGRGRVAAVVTPMGTFTRTAP